MAGGGVDELESEPALEPDELESLPDPEESELEDPEESPLDGFEDDESPEDASEPSLRLSVL